MPVDTTDTSERATRALEPGSPDTPGATSRPVALSPDTVIRVSGITTFDVLVASAPVETTIP
ncbi:MAG: hypothetical protein AAFZ09_20425, partial [Pseudomonadota bacterium]